VSGLITFNSASSCYIQTHLTLVQLQTQNFINLPRIVTMVDLAAQEMLQVAITPKYLTQFLVWHKCLPSLSFLFQTLSASIPQSVYTTTTVSVYNYHSQCIQLPQSVYTTTTVSVYNYHSQCIQLPQSVYTTTTVSVYNYRSQCIQLPQSVYTTTAVSVYNYHRHHKH
jgi:hypothetical protein